MTYDIETILMLVTFTFNAFLGSVIFIHSERKKSDIGYVFLILALLFWTFSVLGIRVNHDLNTVFFYLALSHVAGLSIAISFWYFVETFTGRVVSAVKLVLAIVPAILISYLAFTSKKFIVNILQLDSLNKDLVMGPYHFLFLAYFSAVMIYAFYLLYLIYGKKENHTLNSAVLYVFWGTFISTLVGAAFNIFYLTLRVSDYIAWGPIATIIMVIFISYAIMRLNLMSIKLIASEIFVIALLITLSIKLFFSTTTSEWVVNGISLGISFVVSFFLIRSVMKEIFQRQRAEGLARDLKNANEGQANLIHVMNHQVKGRLGNAKNIFAELLTDDYGSVPESMKPYLEKGLEETSKGVDYVQGILRGASAESGQMQFDMLSMNLKDVVQDSFTRMKDYAEKKGLAITLDIKPGDYNMKGDAVELGESVRNLIDNSINYTETGSINLTLYSKDTVNLIEVTDTGVGISSEDMPKLFKSGGRGTDSLKINVNSTGYGLAFVKGVVEAHKGRVWVESGGKGKGSSFFVEIPKT